MADVSHNKHLKAIKLSTYGVMFFGTPHQGTDGASWGKVLVNVASLFRRASTALPGHLERGSEWLEMQLEQYSSISSEVFTIFCFESYPTPLPEGRSMIISHTSRINQVRVSNIPADGSESVCGCSQMQDTESVEIRKNHTTMVTFRNSSDDDFQTVIGHLSLMCAKTEEKWLRTGSIGRKPRVSLAADIWPNDFNILLMLSYNHNPSFTSRIQDLDQMRGFLEQARQKKRLSVPLVIYGTGGIRKTQLVREFVFARSTDFSSIIWIDARNLQNLRNGFTSFMQKLLECYVGKSRVTPPPYLRIARYLGISGLVDKDGRITADSNALDQILLIYDNVDDLESFRVSNFFPKRMEGSIIVTSRRPECSRLGEGWKEDIMGLQESITLLSKSYGREIKESDSDYEEARQIVEKLGCLPLAIGQTGSHLSMLQKPLRAFLPLFEENFNKTLSKKPPAAF
ncbi:hypothetical protein GQ44DRAFT_774658 [Phaeosphaeriaceae sp. PMI808]|nr:hypothetical protein GQ44DRAFT_774658 [Phaeosphaeriaceae sp. PMI808]